MKISLSLSLSLSLSVCVRACIEVLMYVRAKSAVCGIRVGGVCTCMRFEICDVLV